MLHIGWCPGASLQTIPEENLSSESQGSTETLDDTFTEQLLFLPFWGGVIFNVSVDNPPRNGETRRNASLVRTGTSTTRSAEKTRQLLHGPRLLEIIGSTHKEDHFHSTVT